MFKAFVECLRLARDHAPHRDNRIVVLSANGDVANRINLLEEGVDDYIVKPCSVREVIARSRAVLRRTARTAGIREGTA
jgi:DNA-binding response OmpR family regulator